MSTTRTPEKGPSLWGRFVERVAPRGERRSAKEAYGTWLLGQVTESQSRRRRRIKLIACLYSLLANLTGVGFVVLILCLAFPAPNIYIDGSRWLTFGLAPMCAMLGATVWITARILTESSRWAVEEREPTTADGRKTLVAPFRVAVVHFILWNIAAASLGALYGTIDRVFFSIVYLTVAICGALVATNSYLATEFALRPLAAQALEAGRTLRRFNPGMMTRTMNVWLVGSGVPLAGNALISVISLVVGDLTETQLEIAVLIISLATLVFGYIVMWIMSWLTVTPVRVVRAALKRVEEGDLDGELVVFDGTEIGELQRGFNAMVDGLRERERIRDLFGRHVGREVAAAAERERPKLGGEERHVAVVFIDIVGSTKLVRSRPPVDVVDVLNKFFTIVVEEVDCRQGLVNKFEGDASLAIFGAPNHLDCPEDAALATARAIAHRMATEMSECQAGIGVAAGTVVAGNVGAKERFEYTVIGEPVNEAARLCELAKSHDDRLLASFEMLYSAGEDERALWSPGGTVTLRGHDQPTQLAHLLHPTRPQSLSRELG
ncbi:MAG: adenylate/guanylate cyclase domain-containing protein [Mycobacterium sp.]|nr:MAG: adenylate/guanylate cyclase domain-containing protein [Mycobacterium sp.]